MGPGAASRENNWSTTRRGIENGIIRTYAKQDFEEITCMSSIVLNQMLQRGVIVALLTLAAPVRAEWIWVEGEQPSQSTMNRHPWYDQVKREELVRRRLHQQLQRTEGRRGGVYLHSERRWPVRFLGASQSGAGTAVVSLGRRALGRRSI